MSDREQDDTPDKPSTSSGDVELEPVGEVRVTHQDLPPRPAPDKMIHQRRPTKPIPDAPAKESRPDDADAQLPESD